MKWWQKIVDVLKGMGVAVPDDKLDELDKALAEFEPKPPAPTPPATAPSPPSVPDGASIAELVQRAVADALRPVNDELAKAKTDRDAIAQQLTAQQAKERDQQVATLLDQAIATGKITPAQRDQYKADLTTAFDVTKGIIERLPDNPTLAKQAANTTRDGKAGDASTNTGKYATAFAKSAPPSAMKYIEEQLA